MKKESNIFSLRFQKNIRLTYHVKARMVKRDISLGWNVNVGMTKNGVGEIVVLDAKAAGLFPLELSEELKAA